MSFKLLVEEFAMCCCRWFNLCVVLFVMMGLACSSASSGATYFVSPCGQDFWAGVQPGCLAPLGPKRTIQAAINAATSGDTVTVLPGVYVETIDFDGKEITVNGAAGPATTIIDGAGDGPVVLCNSFEGPGTTFSGFTVRNGYNEDSNGAGMSIALGTVSISNCIFRDNEAGTGVAGAGIAAQASTITISDCQFLDNVGWSAGGVLVWGGSATVTDCVFDGNNGVNRGGGMYVLDAHVEVTDCSFINGHVGGLDSAGAGLYIDEDSDVTMNGCTISDNVPFRGTAGIHMINGSTLSLVNCDFANNHAQIEQAFGNAIYSLDSSVSMLGCEFSGNTGGDTGGAVYASSSDVSATLCGFVNNATDGGGGAISLNDSSFVGNLCTLTGNASVGSGGGISGFNQSTVELEGCTFSGNASAIGSGGAVRVQEGSLQAASCTFAGNSAATGGGVQVQTSALATFNNCTFNQNEALTGDGGGLDALNTHVTIIGGAFNDNQAGARGGGIAATQGGVGASLSLMNTQFHSNSAATAGGALCSAVATSIRGAGMLNNSAQNAGGIAMIGPFGQADIIASRFDGNSATQVGGALMVGAFSPGGGAKMINCIISKNTAAFGGGAIHESVLGANLHIANCAVVDNQGGGIVIHNAATASMLANTVVWGNTSGGGLGGNVPEIMYCNLQGGAVGIASVSADPKFTNAAAGNYHLAPGSPCIDAGMNVLVPLDEFDLDGDGNTSEFVPVDFDGESRFANNGASDDTGCGGQTVVDMGPYETMGIAVADLGLGDANADGSVNVDDLLIVINSWGACKSDCCPGDFNLDGFIDVDDLLIVINHWG
jgi:predicted outer membrane repeat protein